MSTYIEALYRAFDPSPLQAPEQSGLYIDLDNVRGQSAIVHKLAQRIRLSDRPTCQILAGHRGSGKTTELYRLQADLESDAGKCFVVFCDTGTDIDRNDVDFPDLLIAIVRQLAGQLDQHAGIKLKPGFFKDGLQRIQELLGSEIDFQGFELGADMVKVAGAIKGSPDARREIRKALEPDTSNLLNAANDLIGEAKLELKDRGYSDLAIIIDDLDKMALRVMPETGCTTGEYLFLHRERQLAGFQCHTVYTMPLALAYSHREQMIANQYGGRIPVVPMVKMFSPPPESKPHEPGLKAFRDLIQRRVEKADATMNDVFKSNNVITELIKLSGGQPRELMIIMREAIVGGDLPIDKPAIERATRDVRRAYARQLRGEHWPIIDQVQRTGMIERTEENDELVRELLDSRAILQYVNDDEWYGVNPVLPPQPNQNQT